MARRGPTRGCPTPAAPPDLPNAPVNPLGADIAARIRPVPGRGEDASRVPAAFLLPALPSIVKKCRSFLVLYFAVYIALSALRSRVAASIPSRGYKLMPTLAVTNNSRPAARHGILTAAKSSRAYSAAESAGFRPCEDGRELISTHSRQRVSGTNLLVQPVTDLLQNDISNLMAKSVVDLLEAIEIDEYDSQRLARFRGPPQRRIEFPLQKQAIRQLSERIVVRLVRQLICKLSLMNRRRNALGHHLDDFPRLRMRVSRSHLIA